MTTAFANGRTCGSSRKAASLAACLTFASAGVAAAPCPADATPRADGVQLAVRHEDGRVVAYTLEQLRAIGAQTWTEKRSVAGGAGMAASGSAPAAATEDQTVSYDGVRLRDVIAAGAKGDAERDRDMRRSVFEAVATDDYRVTFSWGELFNAPAGDRTIVVLGVNGRPLDTREGPVALRALGDARPGPRHVRNLCALRIGRPFP